MTIIVPASAVGGSCSTEGNVRFLFENLADIATTITATSEATDFPVENAFDWLASDFYKPATVGINIITLVFGSGATANSFAFYSQDIHESGGTIKLQFLDGVTWTDASATIAPSSNAPVMVYFDVKTALEWRFVLDCANNCAIGVLTFGQFMTPEVGIWTGVQPTTLARDPRIVSNVSQVGLFIGKSILSTGVATTINLEFQGLDWVRDEWLPFLEHAEVKPFFFDWHAVDFPTESAFLWADGKIGKPVNTSHNKMRVSIKVRGQVE